MEESGSQTEGSGSQTEGSGSLEETLNIDENANQNGTETSGSTGNESLDGGSVGVEEQVENGVDSQEVNQIGGNSTEGIIVGVQEGGEEGTEASGVQEGSGPEKTEPDSEVEQTTASSGESQALEEEPVVDNQNDETVVVEQVTSNENESTGIETPENARAFPQPTQVTDAPQVSPRLEEDESGGPLGRTHCGDGYCDGLMGENCSTCPDDCIGGSYNPRRCGNGVCEQGEDCRTCPNDCAGNEGKNVPKESWICCEGGPKEKIRSNPVYVDCTNDFCRTGKQCTLNPAPPSTPFCCGNGRCEQGEGVWNCPTDCSCFDNGICQAFEDETCGDCYY